MCGMGEDGEYRENRDDREYREKRSLSSLSSLYSLSYAAFFPASSRFLNRSIRPPRVEVCFFPV